MKFTSAPASGDPGYKRLAILKALRSYTGMNLKDAKDLLARAQAGEEPDIPSRPLLLSGELPFGASSTECAQELWRLGCGVELGLRPEDQPPTREQVAEVNEEALFCDGLEEALIGYVTRFGQPPLALYDREKIIDIFMAEDECDCESRCQGVCDHAHERAVEMFDFNVIGAWMGENTPAFATLLQRDGE